MRMAYTSRLKTILDTESKLRYAMTKGKEEGIKEGREKGINLSALSTLTGYSEQDG